MSKVKNKDTRILVVDDEPLMSDSLRQHLTDEGYAVDVSSSGTQAIDLFDGGAHHLVICDLQLPDMDGLELLRHMKDAKPSTEVIVVTGYGSVQVAVEAIKSGAFYFVEKPFDIDELLPLVEKALERRELVAETANMRRQLSTRAEYFNIIGSSKPMQTIYETIESVAKSDANVLIVGESGTGKELIANAVHYNSLRAKKPFIKVNCAALPKELTRVRAVRPHQRRLHRAHADKEGLVQHAAGGSLMLDEIAEMPVELQPKLLRVLQERSCRKIGSEKSYPVDFRLICSTNRMPADAIRDGLLRDDLFIASQLSPSTCRRCASGWRIFNYSAITFSKSIPRSITGRFMAYRSRPTSVSSLIPGPVRPRIAERPRACSAACEGRSNRTRRSTVRQRHHAVRYFTGDGLGCSA